jgi:hypothetical protein
MDCRDAEWTKPQIKGRLSHLLVDIQHIRDIDQSQKMCWIGMGSQLLYCSAIAGSKIQIG